MKKRNVIFIIIIAVLVMVGSIFFNYTNWINVKISHDLDIKIPYSLKFDYTDDHGGFFGDGTTLAKAKLSDKEINIIVRESKIEWRVLPFSENVNIRLYGKEEENMTYGYHLAQDLHMDELKKGYWIFLDRSRNERKFSDGEELGPSLSFNFSIAIIDIENNMFYYIKEDI